MKKTEQIQTTHFTMKVSTPANLASARIGLMLHGWTGDENSMWVFTSHLDDDWLLIAPRAPYPSQGTDRGGFSWVDQRIDHWPLFIDFLPAIEKLHHDLAEVEVKFPEADFSQIAIFGFSQGAAMSFAYSMIRPEKIKKLGLLSGFIPDNSEGFIRRSGVRPIEIFIGHGSSDQIVPVEKANKGITLLREFGYFPKFCITDVGHRLGSDCFKALTDFLNQRL